MSACSSISCSDTSCSSGSAKRPADVEVAVYTVWTFDAKPSIHSGGMTPTFFPNSLSSLTSPLSDTRKSLSPKKPGLYIPPFLKTNTVEPKKPGSLSVWLSYRKRTVPKSLSSRISSPLMTQSSKYPGIVYLFFMVHHLPSNHFRRLFLLKTEYRNPKRHPFRKSFQNCSLAGFRVGSRRGGLFWPPYGYPKYPFCSDIL